MLHAVVLGGPGRLLHSIRRFCTAKFRPRSAMLVAAGAVVFLCAGTGNAQAPIQQGPELTAAGSSM
jgi:hypothetical protein